MSRIHDLMDELVIAAAQVRADADKGDDLIVLIGGLLRIRDAAREASLGLSVMPELLGLRVFAELVALSADDAIRAAAKAMNDETLIGEAGAAAAWPLEYADTFSTLFRERVPDETEATRSDA